ncbi:MAG: DUF4476 domain-containing protein [Leptospiraceae bacterium]|nr:DUF4476 domain-containing protein [Leptospiraceae bacterium]
MKFKIFIFGIYLLASFGLFSQAVRSVGMTESSFTSLMSNFEDAIDSNKINILENMSSEKYSCYQAQKILITFSLGSYRVDAFKILATKIEDPENKGNIMTAFKDDIGSYKSEAYKVLNTIKVVTKQEIPAKSTVALKGKVSLIKKENNCENNDEETFYIEDKVIFAFSANKPVDTTSLEIWISNCKNNNDRSCYTPFSKKTEDILPDWNGLQYETPQSLKNILSNRGANNIPTKDQWYHFAIIIQNKIIAEKVFEIRNTCK